MNNLSKINGILLEEKTPFSLSSIYYKEESYTGRYSIANHLTYAIQVSFEPISDEIKAKNLPVSINSRNENEIAINFIPKSTGEKTFKLFITYVRQVSPLLLWEKTMSVKDKESKKPNIEASVQTGLPKSMKLGQRAGVIFLFTNKGESEATGISIEINKIGA